MTLIETKARVLKNIEYGIIGLEADTDALVALLAACESEEAVAEMKRTALRWEWAVSPVPDHLTWEEAMRSSLSPLAA